MNTDYLAGFAAKCAERGVDPELLLKRAQVMRAPPPEAPNSAGLAAGLGGLAGTGIGLWAAKPLFRASPRVAMITTLLSGLLGGGIGAAGTRIGKTE